MSSFRNILCAYSGDATRGSGLAYAAGLARQNDGWLTGVLRHGTPRLEKRYSGLLADTVVRALRDADRRHIDDAAVLFGRVAEKYGLTDRAEFIELNPEDGLGLSDLARAYDLIVCGLPGDAAGEAHLAGRPEQIALQSGRPVLVVPNGCRFDGPVQRALIAWDGKRAAARAVGDALPMLRRGAEVVLLTVGRHPPAPVPGGGVMAWLHRHGVAVDHVHMEGGRGSVAPAIRDTAEARGADLVVMGAFEHAKFGQDIWGGVTTEMFSQPGRPLFMSH